jgi:hypothetical protein
MSAVAADLPRTLAEFAAAPDGLLAHLRASGEARRLAVDGGRTVVVTADEASAEDEAEMREYLRQAKDDIRAGDVIDAREFVQSLGSPGGPKL